MSTCFLDSEATPDAEAVDGLENHFLSIQTDKKIILILGPFKSSRQI